MTPRGLFNRNLFLDPPKHPDWRAIFEEEPPSYRGIESNVGRKFGEEGTKTEIFPRVLGEAQRRRGRKKRKEMN